MEKVKEIVSGFIKVPPEHIGPATPIGRSAVQSSILLHRMFARLADEGIRIADYSTIRVFGDLSPGIPASAASPSSPLTFSSEPGFSESTPVLSPGQPSVGIDIEEIASLPRVTDFRGDEFYKMNFTQEEMAWCIMQQDPYASFTGLFAVKEAILKAGGHRKGQPFHTIRVTHSSEGKPLFPGYAISISHSSGLAVAVAVRSAGNFPAEIPMTASSEIHRAGDKAHISWVAWLALVIGLAALSMVIIHRA